MPVIRLPAPLRPLTGGAATVEVLGGTVADSLRSLGRDHPGVLDRLLDDNGDLHRFVNVFVGEADVRDAAGLATAVAPDDLITIVPAVAGG